MCRIRIAGEAHDREDVAAAAAVRRAGRAVRPEVTARTIILAISMI
jgi:hypothetical protein